MTLLDSALCGAWLVGLLWCHGNALIPQYIQQPKAPRNVGQYPTAVFGVCFVILRSALIVCRSEGRKEVPVPAAAPEEQEDGEVQMATPVAQTAPGTQVCLAHHHVDVRVTQLWRSM